MSGDGGRDPLEGVDPEVLSWHWGALAGDLAVCCAPQPGRDGYPCINNRAYHFEHRDVLGRTWPVREEPLYVAAPRLTAGPDGTVTVPTVDHGPVALTCPHWCIGHEAAPKHRADLGHESSDFLMQVPLPGGPVTLMTALFEQRPFAARRPGTGVFLNVEVDGQFYPLDPDQVGELADSLLTVAVDLRVLARRLVRYIAEEAGR